MMEMLYTLALGAANPMRGSSVRKKRECLPDFNLICDMETEKVHAIYQGPAEINDLMPGWGYDLKIARRDGLVLICHLTEDAAWKTMSANEFSNNWRIVKKRV